MQDNKPLQKRKKIVVIGGGTGVFTVLSGLRKYPVDLTAVVSMADDGGSTGVLREEFGILPPGDIRRALVALSHSDRILCDLFNYRFQEGGLRGHTFGNIMLTAFERMTGSFEEAVARAAQVLNVKGTVLPVTLDHVRLCAKLEDGTVVRGETNIDIPKHDGRLKIVQAWLEPAGLLNKKARAALLAADLIVIGPGDLYTSIVPNLLVKGMRSALKRSRAPKMYVVNVMTKWGETHGFSAMDFVNVVERYAGRRILDHIVVNTAKPSRQQMRFYEKEQSQFIEASSLPPKSVSTLGDFLRGRGFVRHDPDRLARAIMALV